MHLRSSVELRSAFRTSLVRAAGGTAMTLGIWYAASAAADEEPQPAAAPVVFAEDIAAGATSVLVESREATRDEVVTVPSDDSSLEPISRVAEHEPELAADAEASDQEATAQNTGSNASDADEEALQFGAALTQAARESISGGQRRDQAPSQPVAPINTDLDEARAKIARFNGLQPGTSTYDDVVDGWGEPAEKLEIEEGWVLIYTTKPFRQIELVVKDDLVHTIKIELDQPLSSRKLIEQLNLDTIVPADVLDDNGQLLGQVFPERGVLFMFTPVGGRVSDVLNSYDVEYIVIQPLDAAAFTLRAENRLHGPYEQNIRDLELAISLEPENAHAHWLLAAVYLATGQIHQAETAAEKALQLEPASDAYRLRRASALEMQADYDRAVHETRDVLDSPSAPQVVKAQALHQMGRLATWGDRDIRSKAIPFFTKAIEIADSLATSTDAKERRAAKELLVEAHLSIAREIAAQKYNNKLESISQWITRASGLAEDAIANDDLSPALRLQVAEASLAALAELKPTMDPQPWVTEAQSAADELMAQYDDTLWRRHVQWQLGVAYFHAIRIEHTRRQTAMALKYGEKAIDNLAEGAKCREAVPDSEHLVGRLYFHIGAIHAVHEKDHDAAVVWYEKATPLLSSPVPVTELAVPRRHGEALVSMGVTYWQLGQRAKALELTRSGADQIERAVENGVLEQDALAVPYGNLATMHNELGNRDEGNRYANLAQNARMAASMDAAATSDTPNTARRPMAAQPGRTASGPMSPAGNAMQRRNMAANQRNMPHNPRQQSTGATTHSAAPGNQAMQRRNVASNAPAQTRNQSSSQSPSSGNNSGGSQMNIHPELRGRG